MTFGLTIEKVRDAVMAYVRGVAEQDRQALEELFAETAHITGVDESRFVSVPRDRWIDAICDPQRAGWGAHDYHISSVAIAESAGVAIVRTRYGRFTYEDVLTILSAGAAIRVTGKTFHQHSAI